MKRTVHYDKALVAPEVGFSAVVMPLDHTSPNVSNVKPCWTSQVVAVDGEDFETLNTFYKKVKAVRI